MDRYENIKAELGLCTGERTKGYAFSCRGHLYKCSSCGNIGCRQTKEEACTAQGFDVGFHCVKCNAIGEPEALTVDYISTQAWRHVESAPGESSPGLS